MKKFMAMLLIGIMAMSFASCQSQTPYIGENGNWWIGNQNLGIAPRDPQDEQGSSKTNKENNSLSATEIAKILKQSTVIVYGGKRGVSWSSGTGFVASKNGYIITLYSIIKNYDTIEIVTSDGQTKTGELMAYNEAENIAFIKVDCDFPVIPIGNSSDVSQGEIVYAIGEKDNTLIFSHGVISATDSVFTHTGTQYVYDTKTFLTDASFGDRSNCGVLANHEGKVIGLAFDLSSSIHHVLPINTIMKLVESVEKTGNCNNLVTENTQIRPLIGN